MKKSVIYEQQRRIAVFDIFLPAARRRSSGDAAVLRDATGRIIRPAVLDAGLQDRLDLLQKSTRAEQI